MRAPTTYESYLKYPNRPFRHDEYVGRNRENRNYEQRLPIRSFGVCGVARVRAHEFRITIDVYLARITYIKS